MTPTGTPHLLLHFLPRSKVQMDRRETMIERMEREGF
jgi:hypothetical protein